MNPALFTSMSDMIEDALMATLPTLIKGIHIAEIGQGSESIRILGVRWLPPGDAALDKDGLKAEEGDFVNLEMALAYRARESSDKSKDRSANTHLLVQFWTTGGLMLPVWVELLGFLGTARMRVQLTPNPPFLSVLTLTFIGQPRIRISCTPLTKTFFNLMDIPGLSGWMQSAIDSVVAEYVAPKSLTLDLKSLLTGREKMDTETVGVLWVTVKSAKGFKDGDAEDMFAKTAAQKKGDTYVTVGWSKLGRSVWATR